MHKGAVSRVCARYAQAVLTVRITYVLKFYYYYRDIFFPVRVLLLSISNDIVFYS